LCYVLARQWKARLKLLRDEGRDINTLIDHAVSWALASIDSMLVRHLIGFRLKIPKWPAEWADWAHEYEGDLQFIRRQNNA
jgi:hypothetical protein